MWRVGAGRAWSMFTSGVESAAGLCNANQMKALPSAEKTEGYTFRERLQRRTHIARCKETLAEEHAEREGCSFTESADKQKAVHAHTPVHKHNMCSAKAKTLLTVLNKPLNHLCQMDGSEEREEEAVSLAGKRHNKCIVFQSENLESKSHLPGDARGLLFLAICNFK